MVQLNLFPLFKHFNLKAFSDNSSCTKMKYLFALLSSLGVLFSAASDITAFNHLHQDVAVPIVWAKCYLAVLFLGWMLDCVDFFYARDVVYKRDDMSSMLMDSMSSKMFQVQSLRHFVLYQQASSNVGFCDGILMGVLSGIQNGKRLLLVSIPQAVIMGVALYYNNEHEFEERKLPNLKSMIIYSINLITLFGDITRLIHLIILYPCIRCCLCGMVDRSMSLWDFLNLRIEKALNKMLRDPNIASALFTEEKKKFEVQGSDSKKKMK
jgi:hypothetical protein